MADGLVSEQRDAAIDYVGILFAADEIDDETFRMATDRVLAASSTDDLAMVVAALPKPVAMTDPQRRLSEPLVLDTNTGRIRMSSAWQLGQRTIVNCNTGSVVLDLTVAEFDSEIIDLDLNVNTGRIEVIVPAGVDVRLVQVVGRLDNRLGTDLGVVGAPCLRVRARSGTGRVTLRRPRPVRSRRRFRIRRRRQT